MISGIAAASFALLLNAPTLITNLENLPVDVSRLAAKYLSWYHEDVAWTGFWSTAYPEGYVDFEEMDLSDVKLGIDITSTRGDIFGTIAAKGICKLPPIAGFLHIEGKVSMSGKEAVITAFDWVGGKRRKFTSLKLRRDENILTVSPIDGIVDLFPQEARIARYPDNDSQISEYGYPDEHSEISATYAENLCEDRRKELKERLKKIARCEYRSTSFISTLLLKKNSKINIFWGRISAL